MDIKLTLRQWMKGVPKSVRLDVARKQENDDHKRGAREAYFDLIDYRTIVLDNWQLFQKLVGYGKKNESKVKQTKWMVDVNEWRSQVAHASSGVILRVEALSELEQYEAWLTSKVSSIDEDEGGEDNDGSSSEKDAEN